MHAARTIDRGDALDDLPCLRAVASGVHRERPADRSRNPGQEFRAGQLMKRRESRNLWRSDAGLRRNIAVLQFRTKSGRVHGHDSSGEAAVANQEVRTEAHEEKRLILPVLPQERREVGKIRRNEISGRAPAGAPADMARHRLILAQLAAKSAEVDRLGHVHASCAGTLPIEPAPMVRTTSPSWAARRIASGM